MITTTKCITNFFFKFKLLPEKCISRMGDHWSGALFLVENSNSLHDHQPFLSETNTYIHTNPWRVTSIASLRLANIASWRGALFGLGPADKYKY